jgi:hypothetical protein
MSSISPPNPQCIQTHVRPRRRPPPATLLSIPVTHSGCGLCLEGGNVGRTAVSSCFGLEGFVRANRIDRRNNMKVPTIVLLATTLVLASCSKETPVAPVVARPVSPPAAPPANTERIRMWLSAARTSLYDGEEFLIAFRITTESGTILPATSQATWSSSNPAVVAVAPFDLLRARVVGVSAGSAIITATYEGKKDSVLISVSAAPSGTAELVIESFRMLEIQYPGNSGWSYAPQMVAKASGTSNVVQITNFQFSIPGLGAIPPCKTNLKMPSAAVQMFTYLYGEYQLEISGGGQVRATGPAATAIITVTDFRGVSRTMVVTGPIVSASPPPATNDGDKLWWSCSG